MMNTENKLADLGVKLKELRLISGVTQTELAESIGIRYQSYQAYEKGYSYPTLQNLVNLAQYFDVSTDYLLGLADN